MEHVEELRVLFSTESKSGFWSTFKNHSGKTTVVGRRATELCGFTFAGFTLGAMIRFAQEVYRTFFGVIAPKLLVVADHLTRKDNELLHSLQIFLEYDVPFNDA
jgi:hypothetical protein